MDIIFWAHFDVLILSYFCSKTTSCFEPSRSDVFVMTQNGYGDKGQHLVCVCHLLTLLCTTMKKKIPRGNADTAPLNPQPYEIQRICNLESTILELQSLAVSSTDIPKKNGDFFRIATFSAKKYTTAHKCKTLAKNFNLPFNQGQSELCSLAFAINIDFEELIRGLKNSPISLGLF